MLPTRPVHHSPHRFRLSGFSFLLPAAIFVCTLLFANGCLRNSMMTDPAKLDNALSSAMKKYANGGDLNYFKLPDSEDFKSIPQDPRNRLSREKVELGKLLFHETGLATATRFESSRGTYSCASCHHVSAGFQAGITQGIAEGGSGFGNSGAGRKAIPGFPEDSIDVQMIRTPTAMHGAWQECQMWNGQFGATGPNAETMANWKRNDPTEKNFLGYQGLETQAIAAIDVHRMDIDTNLIFRTEYKEMFDAAFPNVPANKRYSKEMAGLAIAAYERTMIANRSPWQLYLRGEKGAMTNNQKRGALIFFREGECASCHTGPALNSMEFFALGMDDFEGFGILGPKPDLPTQQGRGGFTRMPEDKYKFKVPQLYNLKYVTALGHGGSFHSVREVVNYKNAGKSENRKVPETSLAEEFYPLDLDGYQVQALVDFLENALQDKELERYVPASLPSGNCFPNNDLQSRIDLGCK